MLSPMVAYTSRIIMQAIPARVIAKCRETSMNSLSARLESGLAITRFQTGVSWHFGSLKDKVLKIEL